MIKTFFALMILALAMPFTARAKGQKPEKKVVRVQKNKLRESSSSSSCSSLSSSSCGNSFSSSDECCHRHKASWAQFTFIKFHDEEQLVAPNEPVKWGRKTML